MHPELEVVLNAIRGDRLSGASTLACNASLMLKMVCERCRGTEMQSDLEDFALSLIRTQPNMGSIWNLANGILHHSTDPESLISFCDSMVTHHRQSTPIMADHASRIIEGKRVLTTSSSSAVFHSLAKAASRSSISAFVCESRPMREGVLMARELSNIGVASTVIADAALALYSSKADIAVVGADTVNKEGVIGKIGLVHLAMACERAGIPLVLLADTSKFAPITLTEDPRDPTELLESTYSGVRAENLYFEQLELGRVSLIISEKGRMSIADAQRVVWGAKIHPKLAPKG
jgi:translation initiation factor eIF-2B subunit delta